MGGESKVMSCKRVDFAKFLSTKPSVPSRKGATAASSGTSDEEDFGPAIRDFDPEDVDFGGTIDQTSAASKLAKKRQRQRQQQPQQSTTETRDESRSHYRGLENGLTTKRGKRMVPLPIDEEEFMGGKYAGVKVSRASLGFATPSPSSEEQEGAPSPSSSEDDEGEPLEQDAAAATTEKGDSRALLWAQLRAFREAEAAQVQMVARKATDDVERGQQVREQLHKWQAALGMRIRMQPLLSQVQRLPSPAIWRALCETPGDEEMAQAGKEAVGALEELATLFTRYVTPDSDHHPIEAALANYDATQSAVWKDSLEKWHQRVALAAEGGSAKRQLKVINQSLWAQVESALANRGQLMERAHRRRSQVSPLITEYPAFDDGDFFSVLVRSWTDLGTDADAALAAGLVVRSVKHRSRTAVDPRSSKGRRLRYDVQDKLVNFMVPERDALAWTDERIDALFASVFPEAEPVASV